MLLKSRKTLFNLLSFIIIIAAVLFVSKVIISSMPDSGSKSQSISQPEAKKLKLMSGTLYPELRQIKSFTLVDHQKQNFSTNDLKGQWHLFFMGFTHCPHICPTEMLTLSQIYKKLPLELQQQLNIVFVTTDPLRDTPDVVAEYLSRYEDDFIGLTGTKEQIKVFARLFAMAFLPSNETDKTKDYEVNHSATFYLTDPQANLYALFSTPHQSEKILADMIQILSQ
jgi:protein SCO1/2